MPWTEDEFRRALGAAAESQRPNPQALGMLRAGARRRGRARLIGYGFAAAAAAVVIIGVVSYRPVQRQDVELSAPGPAGPAANASPPVVREQADGGSILARVSGDGRFVVFMSDSSKLVPGDANGASDTFVRDLSTGRLERVSLSSSGAQGNGPSYSAAISADGRYVAFRSSASNLVPDDTNGVSDIFLRDRAAGTTTAVSVTSKGALANGASDAASISADGRLVAFRSSASNLVPGDTNGRPDIFARNVAAGTTERVSVSSSGTQTNGESRSPQISADGTRVAFASIASTLVPGDTNHTWDVFVRDLSTGEIVRASVGSDGRQGGLESVFPAISADGRFVAFISPSSHLVPGDTNGIRDVFLRDLAARTTERVSVASDGRGANGPSLSVSLSADGRFVAFSSDASNLVAGDTNHHRDVFVKDLSTGAVTMVSVSSAGAAGDADSGGAAISADGRFVAFQSFATTLSAAGDDRVLDVFVRDLANRTTILVSVGRTR